VVHGVRVRAESIGGPADQLSFLGGMRACLPVVLGYLGIGFAAGVVERSVGFSIAEIALLSLILFAGSGQFITAGMYGAGSPLPSIVVTIFFVNLRHLLLSASLAPHFRQEPAWRHVLIGAQLTDETFGVASSTISRSAVTGRWMMGLNLTAYVTWAAANVAGGVVGKLVSNPETFGLDFALSAMFAGLLVLQLTARSRLGVGIAVALIAGGLSVLGAAVLPGSWSVIVATVIAATVGLVAEWR
jgi:4-azaleucine resistance transporter AzlC